MLLWSWKYKQFIQCHFLIHNAVAMCSHASYHSSHRSRLTTFFHNWTFKRKLFISFFYLGSWSWFGAWLWWQEILKSILEFQERVKNSPKTVVIWWTIVTLYSTHCNICHVSGDIETTAQHSGLPGSVYGDNVLLSRHISPMSWEFLELRHFVRHYTVI